MRKVTFDPSAIAMFPELSDPRIQDIVSSATGQMAIACMAAEAAILEQVTQATLEFGCSAALELLNLATATGATMPSVTAVLRLQIKRHAEQPDRPHWNVKSRASREFQDAVNGVISMNANLDAAVGAFRIKIRRTIDEAMSRTAGETMQ